MSNADEALRGGDRMREGSAHGRWSGALHELTKRRLAQMGVPASEADELAHEVVVMLWSKRDQYSPAEGSWEDWTVGFARRHARVWRRRKAKQAAREVPLEHLEAELPDHGEVMEDAFESATRGLSTLDRQIFDLRFKTDKQTSQISEELGISHAAVRQRLARAVERLRQDPAVRTALLG